jgi:hypothetical protein
VSDPPPVTFLRELTRHGTPPWIHREKWERSLEWSHRLDAGYPKVGVYAVSGIEEDVVVRVVGDVFDVEFCARSGTSRRGSDRCTIMQSIHAVDLVQRCTTE